MAEDTQRASKPPSSAEVLQARIHGIANRLRLIRAVDAICWALALVLGGLVLVAWMDIIWHLPLGVRQGVLPVALVALCSIAVLRIYRRWKSSLAPSIARRMDEVAGTGGQILSGWDLMSNPSPRDTGPLASLAKAIASVAIDQASKQAVKVAAYEAASWGESRRSATAASAVAVLILFFSLVAPHAFGTSWKRLFAPSLDTPPYSPLVFDVSPGNVKLNYGKPLEVTASISGGAAENAFLVLGNPDDPSADRVSMFARGGGTWQAVVPRLTRSTAYCVTAERGRSATYHVEILQVPKIESVTFAITPPAYTGLPVRKGRHPRDHISGLLTTQVELEITANRPLHGGSVQVEPSKDAGDAIAETRPLQVSSSDPRRVTGIVSITCSGTWTVSVTGSNRVAAETPVMLEVDLLVDQPPIARIAQPRQRSLATPDSRIPIVVVGEDDFGLARLRLYRMIDGSPPTPHDFPLDSSRRVAQGSTTLPLDAYGVRPGDRITLLARADDTRPDITQGGESPLAEIEVISRHDFNRLVAARQGRQMLQNKFRQAHRMLDRLATELAELQEAIDDSDKDDPEQQQANQQQLEKLQQKMDDVADQLERLADQPLPLEVDEHWNDLLRSHADALRQACVDCRAMSKDGRTTEDQAKELRSKLDRLRQQQSEQIGQPLEALRKIAPLIASESRFVQLVARQRVVVDQLDRFRKLDSVRDQADRQTIVKLREEESAIRRSMSDLISDIQSQAMQLGEDPDLHDLKQSSLDFVAAVRASDIDSELSQTRQSLGNFHGTDGYAHALRALEEMERFVSQCKSNSDRAGQCLKKKFAPGIPKGSGDSLSQMLAQMGLRPGPRSGYSMRGNSGQNVGLYGNQPFAERSGTGQGESGPAMAAGGQRRAGSPSNDDGDEDMMSLPESARGRSSEVPLRYRRQAENYLRRLAEHMEP